MWKSTHTRTDTPDPVLQGTVALQALESEVENRLRPVLEADIEKRLREALEAEYERRIEDVRRDERHRYDEQLGQYRSDVEAELDERLYRDSEKARQALEERYLDRIEAAHRETNVWQQRAETAERAVLGLLEGLLPGKRRRHLGRDATVKTLDVTTLNAVLTHHKLKICAASTESKFVVECQTEQGVQPRHLFWREPLEPTP
jgi:hypothetical protein